MINIVSINGIIIQGVVGEDGDRGKPGKAGPLGQAGDKGSKGAPGYAGKDGSNGPKGFFGEDGILKIQVVLICYSFITVFVRLLRFAWNSRIGWFTRFIRSRFRRN